MRPKFCVIRTQILPTAIFFLTVLSGFLMSLAPAQAQVSTESPPVEITQGWQYRWGDSPIDEKGILLWTYDNMESPE